MADVLLNSIFCMLIIGVLLLGTRLVNSEEKKSANSFTVLLIVAFIYLLLNMWSDLLEGDTNNISLQFIVNLLCFIAIDFLIISFAVYLNSLLVSFKGEGDKSVNIVVVSSVVRIIVVLVLAFTGNLFSVETGYYVEQSLAIVPYLISGVIMLEYLAIVIKNRACFTTRTFVGIITYLVLPLVPILIELYYKVYSLTGTAITLSILIVYVLIQATTIENGKMRESVLQDISSTDLLTGLNNRRAYYEYMEKLDENSNVGVIFCDINGLKYVNDHFGHAQGDELIKKFAKLLSDSFRVEEVFRISGDEFVILMKDISQAAFEKRISFFRELVAENSSISAVGSSYGTVICIDKLITEAESKMYDDKRQHKNKGAY